MYNLRWAFMQHYRRYLPVLMPHMDSTLCYLEIHKSPQTHSIILPDRWGSHQYVAWHYLTACERSCRWLCSRLLVINYLFLLYSLLSRGFPGLLAARSNFSVLKLTVVVKAKTNFNRTVVFHNDRRPENSLQNPQRYRQVAVWTSCIEFWAIHIGSP